MQWFWDQYTTDEKERDEGFVMLNALRGTNAAGAAIAQAIEYTRRALA